MPRISNKNINEKKEVTVVNADSNNIKIESNEEIEKKKLKKEIERLQEIVEQLVANQAVNNKTSTNNEFKGKSNISYTDIEPNKRILTIHMVNAGAIK